MSLDRLDIRDKCYAMGSLIHTLLRLKVASREVEYWGFLSSTALNTAIEIHIERMAIKESNIEEVIEHNWNWNNTIHVPAERPDQS